MKILTTNFLTCAVKSCKSSLASYPLHFKDASLEKTSLDYNPLFLRNILPRVNWDALKQTASELALEGYVPEVNPVDVTENEDDKQKGDEVMNDDQLDESLRKLHVLLLETNVTEGKLVCGNCAFEYPIKEGVGNFLLPAHLV